MVLEFYFVLFGAIWASAFPQELQREIIFLELTKTDSPCPLNGIFLPDSNNCSRFKICVEDRLYNFSCPGKLLFNPKTNNCDYESRIEPSDGYCEYPDMFYDKPHFCDCQKFVFCDFGVPTVMDCPSGFRFNLTSGIIPLSFPNNRLNVCKEGDCFA